MVVGHHDVDAAGDGGRHLVGARDAVVHGDNEVGRAGGRHALEGGGGEAVSLPEAPGDERVDRRTEVAQGQGEQGGGAHAVDVEVAEDRDGLPVAHGPLHAVRRLRHARQVERVEPVAPEGRCEEAPHGVEVGESAGGQHAGDEGRDAEALTYGLLDGGVGLEDAPPVAPVKPCHGTPPSPGRGPPLAVFEYATTAAPRCGGGAAAAARGAGPRSRGGRRGGRGTRP